MIITVLLFPFNALELVQKYAASVVISFDAVLKVKIIAEN
jgi:hypothetical protein